MAALMAASGLGLAVKSPEESDGESYKHPKFQTSLYVNSVGNLMVLRMSPGNRACTEFRAYEKSDIDCMKFVTWRFNCTKCFSIWQCLKGKCLQPISHLLHKHFFLVFPGR